MSQFPGKRRRIRALACGLAAGVMLGGAACGSPPVAADRSYRGGVAWPSVAPRASPGSSTPAPPAGPGIPLAGWVDRPQRFGVTLWGSSSCPAVPTRIEATGHDRLSIKFEQAGEKACSADLAPMPHEFTVPGGADTLPLTVALVDGQGVTTYEIVLD